jgi:low affinity Fe/Cu permease
MSDDNVPVHDEVRGHLAPLAGFLAGTGSGLAAIAGILAVVGWLAVGATNRFDAHWHVMLHSVSAAVALVMVFVIQYGTHRQSRAILLKLDELIRTDESARDSVIGVEHAPVVEQERLEEQMRTEAGAGRGGDST